MTQQDIELTEKPGSSGCACGGHNAEEFPELDVQQIPHEIRHATIFGALAGIRPGRGLVICATHDPVPLLQQLSQQQPGVYNVEYLERGPQQWRLQFTLA